MHSQRPANGAGAGTARLAAVRRELEEVRLRVEEHERVIGEKSAAFEGLLEERRQRREEKEKERAWKEEVMGACALVLWGVIIGIVIFYVERRLYVERRV